ncbi:MAG TPA: tRNA pseudouridine(55) synthase TruB [Polyangiaceae bacterium]|nr:tRNA pseudouridine(55) synthase TruB [Polyangiaceae bacterium]
MCSDWGNRPHPQMFMTRVPDGVLVVDKPGKSTSHDIVAQARRVFGTRDVGHAGTLDPMATGVLLLLFGEATKLSGFLTRDRKRYRATVSFGRATDSLDADGQTTEEAVVTREHLSDSAIEAALTTERARRLQVPPLVSAIKVDGRRSYALARAGNAPELAEREVQVEQLLLLSRSEHELVLEVEASKGYYVRALARDLGCSLGLPAHLSALRRLASGRFELRDAAPWPLDPASPLLATAEAARRALPSGILNETGERRARLGQTVELPDFIEPAPAPLLETVAWFGRSGELVALGHERSPGEFRVVRGFRQAGA